METVDDVQYFDPGLYTTHMTLKYNQDGQWTLKAFLILSMYREHRRYVLPDH